MSSTRLSFGLFPVVPDPRLLNGFKYESGAKSAGAKPAPLGGDTLDARVSMGMSRKTVTGTRIK